MCHRFPWSFWGRVAVAVGRLAVELPSATMEKEPSSSSGAGDSRGGTVLYATFAIFTLILAVVAVLAMVLRFGH